MLQEGNKAPLSIKIKDSDGAAVSLRDYKGKRVVLYFYPTDDTTGCTVEALQFRDWSKDIGKLGAVVIGVSKDSPKSHIKFSTKYKLNFPLWSDEGLQLIKSFGVWQKKKFMGREYMGTIRSTFVIGERGKIMKVFPKVTPKNHGEEIFNFLKEIK